ILLFTLCLAVLPAAATTCDNAGSVVSGGATLFDSLLGQTTFNGTNPSGSVASCVFSGDTNNSAVTGGDSHALTFVFHITQNSASDLTEATFSDFGGTIVGLGFSAGSCGGCVAPNTDSAGSNNSLAHFFWTTQWNGPGASDFLIVYTSADNDSLGLDNLN